jgi:hypothetical protein
MTRQGLIDKVKEKQEEERLAEKMVAWANSEKDMSVRMSAIAQNGNSGTHYFEQNSTDGSTRLFSYSEPSCDCDCGGCDEEEVRLEDSFLTMPHDGEFDSFVDLEQEVPTKAQQRKAMPVYSGVLKYFPNAIKEVSKASQAGNDQHHPGTELHWDMEKSKDEYDALTRHLIDHSINPIDDDGMLHLTKVAWRALAGLERYLTNKY